MIWLSSRLQLYAEEDMAAAGRSACALTVRPCYISIRMVFIDIMVHYG